ncbi:putative nucleotidyltransferase, ribonuclease H [Tanacetum coccineum]|uniref:Nucleotidyltransferase, ribonuclease H n=1 Tax=Tanacetum coccineum TaxID=301880 RepID=A0ABQ4WPP7_9ASTR
MASYGRPQHSTNNLCVPEDLHFERFDTEATLFPFSIHRVREENISVQVGYYKPLEVPVGKWTNIYDFVTGLPRTRGKSTTLSGLSGSFFDQTTHFLPIPIVSDRDPRFTSRFWKGLQNAWGTRLKFSTAFHPETDGQSERTIQTLEDMLRSCALEWTGNWDDYICLVEFAFIIHSRHAKYQVRFPLKGDVYTVGNAVCAPLKSVFLGDQVGERVLEGPEMIEVTNEKVAVAREKLKEAQTRQKSYADKHRRSLEFQPGENVFVKFHYRGSSETEDTWGTEESLRTAILIFSHDMVRIFRPFSKDILSIHDSFPQNCYASPFLLVKYCTDDELAAAVSGSGGCYASQIVNKFVKGVPLMVLVVSELDLSMEKSLMAKGGDDGFTLSWANFKELFLPPIFPLRAEQDAPKSREYHSLRQRAGGEQSERPRLSLGSSQVESPGPFSYAWSFTDDAQGLVVVYYVNNNEQQSLRDNKQGNSGGWTANHRNRGQHVPPSYQLGSSKTRRLSRVLYFPVAPHCDVDTQVSVVVLRVLVLVAVQAGLSSERLQRTRVLLVRLVMLTRSLDAIRPRLCADSGPRLLTDYWYITGNCFRVQDRISRRTSRNSTIRDVEFNIEAYSGAEPISKLLSHASDELKELKDQFAMELCGARFYPSQVLSPWEALHHVVLFGQEKMAFLGHISSSEWITMDPARFVDGVFTTGLTLTMLMRKGEKVCLERRAHVEKEIEELKQRLVSALFFLFPIRFSIIPGKANVVADALSRKSGMIAGIKVEEEIIRDLERLDIELCVRGQNGFWASLRVGGLN